MPRLSAFTPTGLLRMSSQPSEAENIYHAVIALLGDNYDTSPGSRMDGWAYALARVLGVVRLTLIHAGLQIAPPYVAEMMGLREQEWQIVPGPDDSLPTRRATLAARELLPQGAARQAVVGALQTLLGSSFVWYRTTKPAELAVWPQALGDQPQNLQIPTVERKRLTVTAPISIGLGSPQAVPYAMVDAEQPALLVGDKLLVEPTDLVRAEVVEIAAVTPSTFTATFSQPHNVGSIGTTMPFPAWISTQRSDLVSVSPSIAVDPETRRKIGDLLERMLRGVSTWQIAAQTGPQTAGPFLIGVSPIGATTFGLVTFP